MKNVVTRNPWSWVPSLYFAEGIPYVIVMTVSLIMYKRMGLSNTEITIYTSWLYLPWVIKPFWSPFIDIIKTKRWWIISMQLLMGAALGGVAFTLPTDFWLQGTLCFFWLMAFSSATHDIAADGFYMMGLDSHQQAWFVGIRSTFYRIATIFGQGMLVALAGNMAILTRNIRFSWSLMFYFTAGLFIALWLYHSWVLPRPREDTDQNMRREEELSETPQAIALAKELIVTIKTFFKKPQVVAGILFMVFYRMPEGLLSKVAALFLVDTSHNGGLNLSDAEYGLVQGTVGVIGLTLGGILGGFAAGRNGLRRWLWPMVVAITIPDLVYVYLSYSMPSSLLIINVCIFIEQFGYGFGFAAYMLYLIYYSQGDHKTSHYALCTALMALSMMIPGLFAGALQEAVGYRLFFIIVVCSCLVTYIVSAFLKIDPSFGKKTGT